MPLVRSGQIVADSYIGIADDAPVPDEVPVIVTAARFLADADELKRRSTPVGVIWPNSRRITELAPHLGKIALVALVFPGFRDGRAYSQARVLRERYNFQGELRATGQVLRDQFLFMLRAGFDSFDVSKEADAAAFVESTKRFDMFYQPTGDGRTTVFHRRLSRAT